MIYVTEVIPVLVCHEACVRTSWRILIGGFAIHLPDNPSNQPIVQAVDPRSPNLERLVQILSRVVVKNVVQMRDHVVDERSCQAAAWVRVDIRIPFVEDRALPTAGR